MLHRIWVCDDNKKMALIITGLIKRFINIEMATCYIDTYFSGKEVVDELTKENKAPDVLFVAIKMKKMSGYKVAEVLGQMHCKTLLIFISAYGELFFDSLKYMPFGYVIKKYMQYEIEFCLRKANTMLTYCEKLFLVLTKCGMSYWFRKRDIIFIESSQKMSFIILNDSTQMPFRDSLASIAKRTDLMNINKSVYVNTRNIRGYVGNRLYMINGYNFPISRKNGLLVKKYICDCFYEADT